MSGYRQSALLLHGISEADQRWILENLNTEDQRILDEHLAELKSLGIPADPALIEAATCDNSASDSSRSSRKRIVADPVQEACATQIHAILAAEPVWLVQQVLALDNWSWKQEFLTALTPDQRERIRVTGEVPIVIGDKLAESLRAQLSLRLAASDRDCASNRLALVPHGLLTSLQKAVRRWL